MKLTHEKLLQLRNTVGYLSNLRPDGTPLYDLGLAPSFAMADTVANLEPRTKALDETKKRLDATITAAQKKLEKDLQDLNLAEVCEEGNKNAAREQFKAEFEAERKEQEDAWEKILKEEIDIPDTQLHRFKFSDLKKTGQSIPPMFLVALRPIMIAGDEPKESPK